MSASPAKDQTDFKAPDFGQYRGRRVVAVALAAGALVWGGHALWHWAERPAPAPPEELTALVPLEKKVAAVVKPPPRRASKSARAVAPAAVAPRAAKATAPHPVEAAHAELAPLSAPPPPPPAEPVAPSTEFALPFASPAPAAEPASSAPPPPVEPAVAAPAPAEPTEPAPVAAPPAEPLSPEPSPTEAALFDPALDGNGEAVARGIAAQKRSAIQQCFEQELKRTPALKGTVTVQMDLAPPHRIDDVRVVDDLERPAFTQCVASTMQHVTFVALNEEVRVQMPFVLSARAK